MPNGSRPAEVDRGAVPVGDQLDLDVAGLLEVFLEVDLAVAEGGCGLLAGHLETLDEVAGRLEALVRALFQAVGDDLRQLWRDSLAAAGFRQPGGVLFWCAEQ